MTSEVIIMEQKTESGDELAKYLESLKSFLKLAEILKLPADLKKEQLEEETIQEIDSIQSLIESNPEMVKSLETTAIKTFIKRTEQIDSIVQKITQLRSVLFYKMYDSLIPEKLIIKNFGAICEVELELKQTTIFIGPQSSGKSTIAKLIDIFRNPRFLTIFGELSQQETSTKDYLPFFEHHNLQNFFEEQTQLEYICDEYRFSYAAGEFKLVFLRQEPENQYLKLLRMLDQQIDLKQISIVQPLYIPAERSFISMASGAFLNLINNNVPITKNILEFGAAFERARNQSTQLPIDFLNVVYKYEDNQDKVYLNAEKHIRLTESASGLQATIPMIAVIESNYKTVPHTFVIEEPELNLYPITQKELVHYLIVRATFAHDNQGANELVITTHSPYILATANLCLFAYRVAQKHPEKLEEIQAIVPQISWLNPTRFNAYYVGEGTAKTIFDPKTGMISESVLDETSEIIGNDFDDLMEIYRQKQNETTH